MAVGQKLQTRGVKIQKFTNRVLPVGEYELKLHAQKASIKTGQAAESRPRISCMFEALGTENEGGKNVKFFWDAFTSMKPGKNGTSMPEWGGGVIALARGFGEELEDASISIIDVGGVPCINPKELLAWLQNRDGQVVKARVKQDKKQDGSLENRVDYFIEGEAATGTDTEYELSSDNAVPEEEELEEEVTPLPPARKAAGKKR